MISISSQDTSCLSDRFDDPAQIDLAHFFAHLHREYGAKLMLSNSDPIQINPNDDFFEVLHQGFHIHRVWASRMIDSQADKRGKIARLLITKYAT